MAEVPFVGKRITGCFFSFSFLEYFLYGLSYTLYGSKSVYNFCVSCRLLYSLIIANDKYYIDINNIKIMFIMFWIQHRDIL